MSMSMSDKIDKSEGRDVKQLWWVAPVPSSVDAHDSCELAFR